MCVQRTLDDRLGTIEGLLRSILSKLSKPDQQFMKLPGDQPSFKFLRDKEVSDFVHHALNAQTTQQEVIKLCSDRFGPDRAPSKSALSRYVKWQREIRNSAGSGAQIE